LARVQKIYQEILQSEGDCVDNSVVKALLDPSTSDPAPLVRLIRDQIWIENFVWIHGSISDEDRAALDNWAALYRQLVNPGVNVTKLFTVVSYDFS
jgi:hypothetical protein